MVVTIYSKTGCSYCNAAKVRLNQLNVKYLDKILDKDFTRKELLELFPDAKTFPQIVDSDGTYIGGYSELIEKSRYRITTDKA